MAVINNIGGLRDGLRHLGMLASRRVSGLSGEIRIDQAPQETIERFRYAIYIGEQRKQLPWADHVRARLPDPMDAGAHHFSYHARTGELKGCVRLHLGERIPTEVVAALGLHRFAGRYDRTFGYVSKLMVERSCRGLGVAHALMEAMVEHGHSAPYHGEIAFFHCHPRLVPFYEKTGFRRFGAEFIDPHVGAQVPMYIMGGDLDHFASCGSSMAGTAARYRISAERKLALLDLLHGSYQPACSPRGNGTDTYSCIPST